MRNKPLPKGFTLVELLIYIVLFGILSTFVYNLFIQNFKTHASQQNAMAMTQDLRAALGLMVRELRLAGYDPTGAGNIGFIDDADDQYNTDGNSIRFSMDITDTYGTGTPDGLTDGPHEDINYYLYTTGGIPYLGRRTGGSGDPQPVAGNITALNFIYTFADGDTGMPDETDGDSTNNLDDIRSVQISISAETAEIDALTKQKKTKTYTTTVRIRNMGL